VLYFYHNNRHLAEMDVADIEAFLTNLAKDEHVFASTQNQALNALLFLYRNVLQIDILFHSIHCALNDQNVCRWMM